MCAKQCRLQNKATLPLLQPYIAVTRHNLHQPESVPQSPTHFSRGKKTPPPTFWPPEPAQSSHTESFPSSPVLRCWPSTAGHSHCQNPTGVTAPGTLSVVVVSSTHTKGEKQRGQSRDSTIKHGCKGKAQSLHCKPHCTLSIRLSHAHTDTLSNPRLGHSDNTSPLAHATTSNTHTHTHLCFKAVKFERESEAALCLCCCDC